MTDYSKWAILSDLDGTLFDSTTKPQKDNIEAIRRFTEQGGLFSVSTGRTPENAATFLDGVVLNAPGIYMNGSEIYDPLKRVMVHASFMEMDLIRPFIGKVLEKYPDVNVQVYGPGIIAFVSPEERAIEDFERQHHPCIFTSLTESPERWMKILMCSEKRSELEEIKKAAEDLCGDSIVTMWSAPLYLEILPPGVTKGFAERKLKAMEPHASRTVIAAGDFSNDFELLDNADIPVAPSNALPEIKEHAAHIACSNDEGCIAWIIDTLIPELEKNL